MPIEELLRRDRAVVTAALVALTALAWWWVLTGSATGMSVPAMTTWQFPPPLAALGAFQSWSPGYAVLMVMMWWIMMIAMMTPAAAPMILLYARAHRYEQRRGALQAGAVPVAAFVFGYLAIWGVFSIAATALQWALEYAGLVHQMLMWSVDRYFVAALLIAAGLYQFTPLKRACLAHCRAPAPYLAQNFRPGTSGAFRLGWRHGGYCVGCCWFLMALLFAGGVMNIVWIAGLTIYVAMEKIAPFGQALAKVAGGAAVLVGLWIAFAAQLA